MNYEKGQPADIPSKPAEPQENAAPADTTVIAKGATASGELSGTGDVLVEGSVIGAIRIHGTVTVAAAGVVKGPIQADSVCVAGCVEGNIAAKTYLRLELTGSITGDVTVSSFIIEDGGYFCGRSQMTGSGEEPVILY